MKYTIEGGQLPVVICELENGETMITEGGAMSWMSPNMQMETTSGGGLGRALGRMFAGESMFMATYTAQAPNSIIAFASSAPGQILALDVGSTGGMICQKGAFLCAQDGVQLDITFTKKLSAGFFGGEGFILQDIHGTGLAFLEIDGDIIDRTLAPGEVLKVDTSNVVAFSRTVKYEIETVKGLGNILFGGEGLFLTKLTGPGRVILQTQNIADFAGRIAQFIPTKSN